MIRFPLSRFSIFCLMAVTVTLCGCVTTGTAPTAVTGSAGGSTTVGAAGDLERCAEPLGTLAIDDGRRADWYGPFGSATQVTTIEPLLRLAIQQSNCFVITSVGSQRTDERLQRITSLQRDSGEYRAGSKQQKGQRVAADYYMEPSIIINNDSTGAAIGSLGGLVGGRHSRAIGAIAGGLESKVSVVTLSLYDIRTAVQISISEGSSTATNFGAAFGALGSRAGGALGGFSRTPEGKATVAAFMNAYNNMVISLRNYQAQDVRGGMGRGGRLHVN